MELIVVSNPSCFKGETVLINKLFEAGLSVFHLRKPGLDRDAYNKLIAEIEPDYHSRVAIHQFHGLVEDYEIKRLHFTEQQRRGGQGKDLANTGLILSTSIHDLSVWTCLDHFSYTFYSPVFDSLSKPGYKGAVRSDFRWPGGGKGPKLIALGGIDVKNLPMVRQMGFDGAAVLGALWNEPPKALHTFNKLKQLWIHSDPT